MSRLGLITINWADGEHSFALKIKQLIELQERCDAGPPLILLRLQSDAWKVNDIRETVRLGLIGAGMTPTDALKLTSRYVDDRPLAENALVAQAILAASLYGAPEGEKDGAAEKREADPEKNHSLTEKSGGPPTLEPASQPV